MGRKFTLIEALGAISSLSLSLYDLRGRYCFPHLQARLRAVKEF